MRAAGAACESNRGIRRMTMLSAVDDVAKLAMRTSEVSSPGIRHTWKLHPQVGSESVLVKSLDDVRSATGTSAHPGQPIGIFDVPEGFRLTPLDAHVNGAAVAGPKYPSIGGLTLEFAHLEALNGSRLVGMTSKQPSGTMGRIYEAGVMSNEERYVRGLVGARR